MVVNRVEGATGLHPKFARRIAGSHVVSRACKCISFVRSSSRSRSAPSSLASRFPMRVLVRRGQRGCFASRRWCKACRQRPSSIFAELTAIPAGVAAGSSVVFVGSPLEGRVLALSPRTARPDRRAAPTTERLRAAVHHAFDRRRSCGGARRRRFAFAQTVRARESDDLRVRIQLQPELRLLRHARPQLELRERAGRVCGRLRCARRRRLPVVRRRARQHLDRQSGRQHRTRHRAQDLSTGRRDRTARAVPDHAAHDRQWHPVLVLGIHASGRVSARRARRQRILLLAVRTRHLFRAAREFVRRAPGVRACGRHSARRVDPRELLGGGVARLQLQPVRSAGSESVRSRSHATADDSPGRAHRRSADHRE